MYASHAGIERTRPIIGGTPVVESLLDTRSS
jgi:hypothetical protein